MVQVGEINIGHINLTGGIPKDYFAAHPIANDFIFDMGTCFVDGKHKGYLELAEGAFNGLENKLHTFKISDCALEGIPKELARMKSLKVLSLNVGLENITARDMEHFEK